MTLQKCYVQNNGDAGFYLHKAGATLKNCLITGNTQEGINVDSDAGNVATIWN